MRNPERQKFLHANWRAKNHDKLMRWQREYRAKNPDLIRARQNAQRAKNRDKRNAQQIAWAIKNREKLRISKCAAQAKRRALEIASAIGDPKEILAWYETWRRKPIVECHWCHGSFSPRTCHGDHAVPLSRGGPHAVENLVISCRTCNVRKRTRLPAEWKAILYHEKEGRPRAEIKLEQIVMEAA